jgi:opacity protein-like surface antigen
MGCAPVLAADPLGFYIGAGVGHSQARNDLDFSNFGVPGFSGPYSIDGSDTGWKLMAGIRPLSVLGAEVAYLDFGSASGSAGTLIVDTPSLSVTTTSHPKAGALFAVGYLPIPLPYLDVFAKAGISELKRDIRGTGQVTCGFILPCTPGFVPPYSASHSSTHPAYGAGAQLRVASLAVRVEYERISAGSGDVDLLSLGISFGF